MKINIYLHEWVLSLRPNGRFSCFSCICFLPNQMEFSLWEPKLQQSHLFWTQRVWERLKTPRFWDFVLRPETQSPPTLVQYLMCRGWINTHWQKFHPVCDVCVASVWKLRIRFMVKSFIPDQNEQLQWMALALVHKFMERWSWKRNKPYMCLKQTIEMWLSRGETCGVRAHWGFDCVSLGPSQQDPTIRVWMNYLGSSSPK